MLTRAALRAVRPSNPSFIARQGHAASLPSSSASLIRLYASGSSKSSKSPPPKSSSREPAKSKRPPPPPLQPHHLQGATGQVRQTSPGTSFPKDQRWKPKDGITLGGPAAATVSGAGSTASGSISEKSAATPVDGSRPESQNEGILETSSAAQEPSAQEPLAQKIDADEPLPGNVRAAAHEAQAASENQPAPPETVAESTSHPQQPLPDLRQGIPSTFEMEFDQNKPRGKQSTDDGLDVASEAPETQQRREREDRDYDRSQYETSLDRKRAQMANWLYAFIATAITTGAFYLSRPYGAREEIPAQFPEEDATGWSPTKMYARMRARMGSQMGYYTEPVFPALLPEVPESQRPPFTLVLSLEDLMIHTTWDREHGYRTAKRPGIDYFIRYLSQYYELVLFTSVPIAMADPVIKKLDPYHFVMWPLGREATKYEGGEYVKDLAYLNRPLEKTLIIDTHAPHVKNQPENAIILPKWKGNPKDASTKDLVALIPFLEYVATMGIDDVRPVLKSFEGTSIPEEFARRESEARKNFNAQLASERAKKPRYSLGSLASGLGVKADRGMGGGMVLADGQSVAEGLAQGKMLSDQIREQGQKQYLYLEEQIRQHGEQWLREEKEEQDKMMAAQMQDVKKNAFGWLPFSKKDE